MAWSLYENGEFLEPLVFSNGKTQQDIVEEVLKSIKEGNKIIFIHGICGTGKSAIALNLAKKLGKTSIIVPGKNLQEQYKKDYEDKKYVLKKDNQKLKISVITGRNNHKCKFLEDHKNVIPKIKREIDSKLHDIFEFRKKEEQKQRDSSADKWDLPCKIEIKEKNWVKIKQYLQKNTRISLSNFTDIKDVTRVSLASVCPYWSPVLPDKYELKNFDESKKYPGLDNENFIFYLGKPGCKFYEQFNSYIDSDVIVFNSLKYKLETSLGRKPFTEAEIVDECDEFLDSFANQKNLNISRLQNSLIHLVDFSEKSDLIVKELSEIIKHIRKNAEIKDAIYSQKIIPLKQTGIYDLFRIFMNNPEFFDEIDDENYLFEVNETVRMFDEFLGESYVTFNNKDNNLIASIVAINLEKKFKEMVDKNKIIILMSGTLHSNQVLKEIFGLENFKMIQAEAEKQGRIDVLKTGLEKNCKYSNFSNGNLSREGYLKALSKCVEIAKKPALIHVNAFGDLPSKEELKKFEINNLISREELKEIQIEDKTGQLIEKFKQGLFDTLFSTRSSRGVDFPGEQCNSIIFTKYPNPNVKDAFWRILNKTNPNHYWSFYKDKARRELWQKVYRGLRSKNDHVYVLSPDERVIEVFQKN